MESWKLECRRISFYRNDLAPVIDVSNFVTNRGGALWSGKDSGIGCNNPNTNSTSGARGFRLMETILRVRLVVVIAKFAMMVIMVVIIKEGYLLYI